MLTGENGILTKANEAKEQTKNANIEEKIDLIKQALKISNYTDKATLKEELKKEFNLQDEEIFGKGNILAFEYNGKTINT